MIKQAGVKIVLLAAVLTLSSGDSYLFSDPPEPTFNPAVGLQPVTAVPNLQVPQTALTPDQAGNIIDMHNITQFNIVGTSDSDLDLASQARWGSLSVPPPQPLPALGTSSDQSDGDTVFNLFTNVSDGGVGGNSRQPTGLTVFDLFTGVGNMSDPPNPRLSIPELNNNWRMDPRKDGDSKNPKPPVITEVGDDDIHIKTDPTIFLMGNEDPLSQPRLDRKGRKPDRVEPERVPTPRELKLADFELSLPPAYRFEPEEVVVLDAVEFTRTIQSINRLLNPPRRLHPWLKWLLYSSRLTPEMLDLYLKALEGRDRIYQRAAASKGKLKIRYGGRVLDVPVFIWPDQAVGRYELVMVKEDASLPAQGPSAPASPYSVPAVVQP